MGEYDCIELLQFIGKCAKQALAEAVDNKDSIKGSINWGDLQIDEVRMAYVLCSGKVSIEERYIVMISEASPSAYELCLFVQEKMYELLRKKEDLLYTDVEVRTGW